MLIAVLTIIVGYAPLWLADLAFKIDFPVLDRRARAEERKTVPDFPDLPDPAHAVFVIALHRAR
jgi:hypothetical protein